MKSKIFRALAGVALSATALSAWAFTEGTDYIKLQEPLPNAKGTYLKIYSYDCPLCFKGRTINSSTPD